MDEGNIDSFLWLMYNIKPEDFKAKTVAIDIEIPSILTYAAVDAQAALNFWSKTKMCKCNKLIDFLCENHRKAIEYRYHSNNPYLESKTVYGIISKHGAWLEVFKFKGDAQNYAREKGYRYHRTVTDFGLTKEVWQHPTQDREYAIIQLEVK